MLHKGLGQASRRPGNVVLTSSRVGLPTLLFAISRRRGIAPATGAAFFAMTVGGLGVTSRGIETA